MNLTSAPTIDSGVAATSEDTQLPEIESVHKVQQPTTHTSRKERRAEARKNKKAGYSKKLGARLNYERKLNVHQKNNTAWDDVNQIRNAANVVLNSPTSLLPFFRSKEISEHIVDRQYLTRCSLAMVEEVRSLYTRLRKNADRHANKSGRAVTMDDTFFAYELYNEYLTILDVYDTGASRLFELVVEQLQLAVGGYVQAVGEEVARPVVDEINKKVQAIMLGQRSARESVPQ